MFHILNGECHNPNCNVVTFTYASCEPPVCPACNVCSECGYPNAEHSFSSCPTSCEDCKKSGNCNLEDNQIGGDCETFERKDIDWSNFDDENGRPIYYDPDGTTPTYSG